MFLIDKLKGVWNKMIGSKTIENTLHITPVVSSEMKNAIELWEDMYKNQSPWLADPNIHSLGLAASIASEKARTATIEMEIKVTGESERAKFIKETVEKLVPLVRRNLEYGIALGSLIVKPYVVPAPEGKYAIKFNFTKATNFYPLAFADDDTITEAAFIDTITTKDAIFRKLEYHSLQGTQLTVKNFAFKTDVKTNVTPVGALASELGERIPLSSVPSWANISESVTIDNIDTMLFGYFKMPEANCIDLTSPLGVSGFARAEKLIQDADEQYSNLKWEFDGGQLAIDVDRTALIPTKDAKGKEGPAVLPKLQDRLYRRNLDLGTDDTYEIFSPTLRDTSIINGLNTILMRIEDVCALSRGTLSEVTYADARTATELKILKQRSYAANCDIQKALQDCLETVVGVIDKYCDLYQIVPKGDYEVAYSWDDSIIVDKDAERQVDLLDINASLLSRIEYRMKWMGETRVQAEKAIKDIDDEKLANMEAQQDLMSKYTTDNSTNDDKKSQSKSDAQAEHDKRQKANDSKVTTNNEGKNNK
jgi:A118 family predicted phage portal protein